MQAVAGWEDHWLAGTRESVGQAFQPGGAAGAQYALGAGLVYIEIASLREKTTLSPSVHSLGSFEFLECLPF